MAIYSNLYTIYNVVYTTFHYIWYTYIYILKIKPNIQINLNLLISAWYSSQLICFIELWSMLTINAHRRNVFKKTITNLVLIVTGNIHTQGNNTSNEVLQNISPAIVVDSHPGFSPPTLVLRHWDLTSQLNSGTLIDWRPMKKSVHITFH